MLLLLVFPKALPTGVQDPVLQLSSLYASDPWSQDKQDPGLARNIVVGTPQERRAP